MAFPAASTSGATFVVCTSFPLWVELTILLLCSRPSPYDQPDAVESAKLLPLHNLQSSLPHHLCLVSHGVPEPSPKPGQEPAHEVAIAWEAGVHQGNHPAGPQNAPDLAHGSGTIRDRAEGKGAEYRVKGAAHIGQVGSISLYQTRRQAGTTQATLSLMYHSKG